jgi:hypothetical protein
MWPVCELNVCMSQTCICAYATHDTVRTEGASQVLVHTRHGEWHTPSEQALQGCTASRRTATGLRLALPAGLRAGEGVHTLAPAALLPGCSLRKELSLGAPAACRHQQEPLAACAASAPAATSKRPTAVASASGVEVTSLRSPSSMGGSSMKAVPCTATAIAL